MEPANAQRPPSYSRDDNDAKVQTEAIASAVSWSAVLAGGFVMAAVALILLSLGAGLGLSSVSVRPNAGALATRMSVAAILWLIVMQVISSSFGGYLAGRLRTKWTRVHSDEVYFRDTAHGFLSWALSLVVTATFLASAAASMAGFTTSTVNQNVRNSQADSRFENDDYFVDALLRSQNVSSDVSAGSAHSEAGRIFANGLQQGALSADDHTYLNRLVAARTGLDQSDADKRVSDVFAQAQQSLESIRKTTAHGLLWIFVSLLIGAFCASFAATIGGKQRDHVAIV